MLEKIIYKINNKIIYIKDSFLSQFFYKNKTINFNFYDNAELVSKIVNEGYSLARFGDGELKWALDIKQNSFQEQNDELQKRLIEILSKPLPNLIVGIPRGLKTVSGFTNKASKVWKLFVYRNYNKYKKIISLDYTYADTNITRFYMDYKDKNYSSVQKRISNLKKIWDNKDILIIEGKYTKIGVGNDLLSNAKSIKRILVPNTNAFYKYPDIINSARKYGKNAMILLAVGPTATVLAYDLSKEGYHAIDVGHMDVEYVWFLNKCKHKTAISGKFVNESNNDNFSACFDDVEYSNSIIMEIE